MKFARLSAARVFTGGPEIALSIPYVLSNGANALLVDGRCSFVNEYGSPNTVIVALKVDGVQLEQSWTTANVGYGDDVSVQFVVTGLAAGAHTIDLIVNPAQNIRVDPVAQGSSCSLRVIETEYAP